jgi:hypothetical protein
VIARNSSFTYKGRAVDVKQVARELGVRYVLEGSVRKSGSRVRITGQLIDTATGAHIWADRFDGALDDIFELQDQVASSVTGALEPKLRSSESSARSASRPKASMPTICTCVRLHSSGNRRPKAGARRSTYCAARWRPTRLTPRPKVCSLGVASSKARTAHSQMKNVPNGCISRGGRSRQGRKISTRLGWPDGPLCAWRASEPAA